MFTFQITSSVSSKPSQLTTAWHLGAPSQARVHGLCSALPAQEQYETRSRAISPDGLWENFLVFMLQQRPQSGIQLFTVHS